MSEVVYKNRRGGRGRGSKSSGSRGFVGSGGGKWQCPNPDCSSWCSGNECSKCNTSRQVAKELDKMLAKREADRNAEREKERMTYGKHDNRRRGGYNRNRYDENSRRNKDKNRRNDKGRGFKDKESKGSRNGKLEGEGEMTDEDKLLNAFDKFRDELDTRHDKMERIVKLGRDITIESKRIIFHLHRIQHETDKESIIEEVQKRLSDVKTNLWSRVAKELRKEEDYQFLRKYSDGLQEWIEALSFYHYIHFKRLISWQEVQQELIFANSTPKIEITAAEDLAKSTEQIDLNSDMNNKSKDDSENCNEITEKGEEGTKERTEKIKEDDSSEEFEDMKIEVPPTEYVLGLADLTGELMRNAINSLSCGDMDICFTLLAFLQKMHAGFLEVEQNCPRVVHRKLTTLKQSMIKVENACYQISVRGSEIPENHLADIFDKKYESGYEDFEA